MSEPRKILVGGDEMLWGEDDVLDFLAQYGHAEVMTQEEKDRCYRKNGSMIPTVGGVYLSRAGRYACIESREPYLLVFREDEGWQVETYNMLGVSRRADLTYALTCYLEARDGKARVG